MSTSNIASVLFPRTRRLIFRELVRATDNGLHIRELARRTGLDPTGIGRELVRLRSAGIVQDKKIGNLKVYSLNKTCPIYNELKFLTIKTVGLADELKDALEPLRQHIDEAFIYGSFASGTETSDSDVDIMVIGDVSLRQVVGVLSEVGMKVSRIINPTVLTVSEYNKRLTDNDGFITTINMGARINLI